MRLAYAAQSPSQALVELLAHIDLSDVPDDLVYVSATLLDEPLPTPPLPDGWDALPPTAASAAVGDRFVRERAALAMAVPSVVVPREYNILINPQHPRFQGTTFGIVEPYSLDPRLVAVKGSPELQKKARRPRRR